MQLRKQTTSVEKVVVKMKSSFVEPALRLHHSLQEPRIVKTAGGAALHDPGLHLGNSATKVSNITMHPHTVQAPLGPIGTAHRIVEREGFAALYKVSGICFRRYDECIYRQ